MTENTHFKYLLFKFEKDNNSYNVLKIINGFGSGQDSRQSFISSKENFQLFMSIPLKQLIC